MSKKKFVYISLIIFLVLASSILIDGKYLEMSRALERIHNETSSATVFFIGFESDFLSFFMNKRSDVLVVNFETPPSEIINAKLLESNAMLVLNEACECTEKLQFLIAKLRVREFVLIFAEKLERLNRIYKFFAMEKFTRIFGSTGTNIYAFFPYANNSIQEVLAKDPVPHALRNLNGFAFRTAFNKDIPRIYRFTDKNGQPKVGGYMANLFLAFVQRHNATVTEVKIKNFEKHFLSAVTRATLNNVIDISMNAHKRVSALELSYPFGLFNWVILVPLNKQLDPNEYFLRPFSSTVWLYFGITLLYVIGMNVLKNICCGRPANIWQCLSRVYLTMLGYSTEKPIHRHGYRFQIHIEIFAFFLVKVYLVYLTSFLTVFIEIHQFRSIHDLIEHKFPVLMINYEWPAISHPDNHPINFERIVKLVDREVFLTEAYSPVHNNHALSMGSDKARFLMEYHKSMRIVDGNLEQYHMGLLLVKHSPFLGILNEFIFDVMDTGLIGKWKRDVPAEVRKHNLVIKRGTSNEIIKPLPLELHHFKFAWICLASGLMLASLAFICEHLIVLVLQKLM